MARTIKRPEDIFVEITEDFQKVYGVDLLSLYLYGSGASGHYVPGKSDLNFLILLTDAGIDDLERSFSLVSSWRKRKVFTIFMTKAYVCSSVDSYPVEFLNMKLNHILVFGVDVFADLSFEPCYLRLQLERELKGKIFHLRQGFLESEGKEKKLRELIILSLGSFMPLFKALLFLKGHEIPHGRREVVKSLSAVYPIDTDIFLKCIDIKEGIGKYSSGEIKSLFKSYNNQIEKLSEYVDSIEA